VRELLLNKAEEILKEANTPDVNDVNRLLLKLIAKFVEDMPAKVLPERAAIMLPARERYVNVVSEVKRLDGKVVREQFWIVKFVRTESPENVLLRRELRPRFVMESAVRLFGGQVLLVM
jgi:hypothetical protein